jgi:hypothetical protein
MKIRPIKADSKKSKTIKDSEWLYENTIVVLEIIMVVLVYKNIVYSDNKNNAIV